MTNSRVLGMITLSQVFQQNVANIFIFANSVLLCEKYSEVMSGPTPKEMFMGESMGKRVSYQVWNE